MREKERLSKIMAARGLCSRREADRFIERGWVLVDGKPVREPGTRVYPDQRIELAPEALRRQRALATFLLHKPVGYVSTQPEKGYPEAAELLMPENRWRGDRSGRRFHPSHLRGLGVAGRLDIDSTGLLVLTQDGRLARRIIGKDRRMEKEYLVRVAGRVTPEKLDRLRHGLELDGRPLLPAVVEERGPGYLRFILVEGRKRQIRRMCEAVGLKVTALKRVRIGNVRLGGLPPGKWRYLAPGESF